MNEHLISFNGILLIPIKFYWNRHLQKGLLPVAWHLCLQSWSSGSAKHLHFTFLRRRWHFCMYLSDFHQVESTGHLGFWACDLLIKWYFLVEVVGGRYIYKLTTLMPNIGKGAFDDKHEGHWNSLIRFRSFWRILIPAKQLHPNISSKQNPVAKSI